MCAKKPREETAVPMEGVETEYDPVASDSLGLVGKRMGDCVLTGVLKVGRWGVIYDARHVELEREVAVKVLRPDASPATDEAKQRFKREAKLPAKLMHPNIVHIYDAGEAEGHLYIEMEKVIGCDLDDYVKKHGRLSVEEAIKIAKELASALDAAHAKEIIHRDIKPQNVIVDSEGTPKLADFGLAKALSHDGVLTAENMRLGTPKYMSPEQCEGATVDHRADIYALGEILYLMLTGVEPFEGGSTTELVAQHLSGRYKPIVKLRPEVPRGLAAIVEKMMALKPDDRYQSARDVLAALDGTGAGARVLPAISRRRLGHVAAGVGLAVLIVFAVALLRRSSSEPLRFNMHMTAQTRDESGRVYEVHLKEGSVLRSGDQFRVHLSTNQRAYAYVLLYGSDGKAKRLFPDAKIEAGNPIDEGKEITLPSHDLWYHLDNVPGNETVYVLASRGPLDEERLSALIDEMEAAGAQPARSTDGETPDPRGVDGTAPDMRPGHAQPELEPIERVTRVVEQTCPNVRALTFKHVGK